MQERRIILWPSHVAYRTNEHVIRLRAQDRPHLFVGRRSEDVAIDSIVDDTGPSRRSVVIAYEPISQSVRHEHVAVSLAAGNRKFDAAMTFILTNVRLAVKRADDRDFREGGRETRVHRGREEMRVNDLRARVADQAAQ